MPSEEEQLRAVTLENARSIFLARQRAEEELVRAQESLREQTEWLRVTLASIGDAVVTTDRQGKVLSLNAVAEQLTGWMQHEALGRPLDEVFRIVNEETRRAVENPAERALQEGRIVGLANHTILIARDGSEIPIDDSAAPIRDDQGNIRGVVLVFRSIAERKQAERALQQSERELADFFENATVGLHWVGPDGMILRVNRAELELLGYSREEYVGHHIAEFHADQDVIADILQRLFASETLRDYEARMRCKDGSLKHVLIDSSVLWVDGQFVHTRCFTRDITDRRRAEEANARLAAIVESSQDAIVSKTLDGEVVSWNAGAEQLFGYRAAEIVGQSITTIIPPERHHEERMILERLRRGERIEHYETVRVTKHGRRLDVSLTISPLFGSDGRIIGASKIARDITVRKHSEQRLAAQNSITHCLAESASLEDAAPLILQAVCGHLQFQVGAFWRVDERDQVLRCTALYRVPGVQVPRFEAASRERVFQRGAGLPGRVWAAGTPIGLRDIAQEEAFVRTVAVPEGLHGALGFPLLLNGEVLGVMEFFSQAVREPEQYLLDMMAAIGSQIGQFVERRRAEAALRLRENQLRVVTDTTPALISYVDADERYWFANRQYELWFGHQRHEIIGRTMTEVLGTSAMQALRPHVDAVLRGESVHFETQAPYRDGGTRWIDAQYLPDKAPDGSVRGFYVFVVDVSDRKQAEQRERELIQRELAATAKFEAVFNQSGIFAGVLDLKGCLQEINELALNWCGYTRAEVLERPFWETPWWRGSEEVRSRIHSATEQARSGQVFREVLPYWLADGTERITDFAMHPIRDQSGAVRFLHPTGIDITERKRAEHATRFLADASAALADLTDQESTLQKVAALAVPHFADWCAVDLQEPEGTLRRLVVAHVNPAKVHLVRELASRNHSRGLDARGVRQVIRTGELEWAAAVADELLVEPTQDEEHLRLMRELSLRSYICVPLKSRTHVLGALTFATAESGRNYNEDDVRAAEDLAHRVVIAIENARLLATLKDSDRRKDEFLAMLAHELRNPLAPIGNAVQILRSSDRPAADLQWATDMIDRQLHQITRLVDDLLDVSRITRGKVEIRKEPLELSEVIQSAIEASRPLLEKRGHDLRVALPPEPVRLEADRTRLAQVFLNLLNNAAKYTDPGGRIELTGERQGDGAVVRIKDNGVGIPPEMLAHVFELFAQVEHSTDRAEGGLGIGLTLVQRLVEMHAGTVTAHSNGPGQGSEFVVRLPIAPQPLPKTRAAAPTGRPNPSTSRRILVVDDNRDAADSLGMLLRMMGHQVETAHDGIEAVAAAAAFQPEVALLDIGLPKLNGYEAARRIREQEAGPGMLLVALTGWGQEDDRRRSKEAGFDHHLTKPVEFATLQKLLVEATVVKK